MVIEGVWRRKEGGHGVWGKKLLVFRKDLARISPFKSISGPEAKELNDIFHVSRPITAKYYDGHNIKTRS